MPGDAKQCREHAKRCWALATEATNPALRESLVDLAQRWARLAADLEQTRKLLEEWGHSSENLGHACYHCDKANGRASA
jgi:hypothetical protein